MKKFAVAAVAATGFAVMAGLGASPAHAIACKGAYQITSGGLIATPYCEDTYLAKVAQSYGLRVSSRSIRQNFNKKREVCYAVGHDTRVSDICAGLIDSGSMRSR